MIQQITIYVTNEETGEETTRYLTKDTDKSPEEVAETLESFAEGLEWKTALIEADRTKKNG